jgi:hypothetical protein
MHVGWWLDRLSRIGTARFTTEALGDRGAFQLSCCPSATDLEPEREVD